MLHRCWTVKQQLVAGSYGWKGGHFWPSRHFRRHFHKSSYSICNEHETNLVEKTSSFIDWGRDWQNERRSRKNYRLGDYLEIAVRQKRNGEWCPGWCGGIRHDWSAASNGQVHQGEFYWWRGWEKVFYMHPFTCTLPYSATVQHTHGEHLVKKEITLTI